jgi:hypothetical protein
MKIGGWKTRSVFERYAIISQTDIRDTMTKLEAGQQRDNAEAAKTRKARKSSLVRVWAESRTKRLKLSPIPH